MPMKSSGCIRAGIQGTRTAKLRSEVERGPKATYSKMSFLRNRDKGEQKADLSREQGREGGKRKSGRKKELLRRL